MPMHARPLRRLVRPLPLLAAALLALVTPARAAAKTVMVIVAHQDDETLMAGGIVHAAKLRGDNVKIAILTNGDANGGTTRGLARQAESVNAAILLGLVEDDVVFLGYGGDALLPLYQAASGTTILTSAAGQTRTYGNRGLGRTPWHRYRFGAQATYTRNNLNTDVQELFRFFQPDEVYTFVSWDEHPDHEHTAKFVANAVQTLRQAGALKPLRIYESFVWDPDSVFAQDSWPCFPGWSAALPYPEPPNLSVSPYEWSRILRFPVPADMTSTDPQVNLKSRAIETYTTQVDSHLRCYSLKDEFFWASQMDPDIALSATASASSEAWAPTVASKVANGIVEGDPRDYRQEWKAGATAGEWVQLTWPADVRISQVNLWDRQMDGEDVTAATLSFSDGSSVEVGALPASGAVRIVTFAPKTVRWVRFTVDAATGAETGLAELAVFGVPASHTANSGPRFLRGPVAASPVLTPGHSTALSLEAWDLDGDSVSVTWSTDGGTLVGAGTTATFTAPIVTAQTVFTISATLADGRGGSETNVAFVTVNPGLSAVAVGPAVIGGGSTAVGLVRLTGVAPFGGTDVAVSSDASAVAVPATVNVPEGATHQTFAVDTSTVTAVTGATVTGTYDGTARSASVSVRPIAVSGISLASPSVVGGSATTGTVTLAFPAGPGGFDVALTASPGITAPAIVTVAAGQSSATFPVGTSTTGALTSGWVTASGGGTTFTARLVRTPSVAVASLSLAPDTVPRGASAVATVTLDAAAPGGGAVVMLATSSAAVASLPAAIAVAGGATSATFPVTGGQVSAMKRATLSATYGGATARARLTVTP